MPEYLSSASTEYVRVAVSARENGAVVDPTGNLVRMAFLARREDQPVEDDWVNAAWEVDGAKFYARTLVGDGATELDPGSWWVWVQVVDNPEVPVKQAGRLHIT